MEKLVKNNVALIFTVCLIMVFCLVASWPVFSQEEPEIVPDAYIDVGKDVVVVVGEDQSYSNTLSDSSLRPPLICKSKNISRDALEQLRLSIIENGDQVGWSRNRRVRKLTYATPMYDPVVVIIYPSDSPDFIRLPIMTSNGGESLVRMMLSTQRAKLAAIKESNPNDTIKAIVFPAPYQDRIRIGIGDKVIGAVVEMTGLTPEDFDFIVVEELAEYKKLFDGRQHGEILIALTPTSEAICIFSTRHYPPQLIALLYDHKTESFTWLHPSDSGDTTLVGKEARILQRFGLDTTI